MSATRTYFLALVAVVGLSLTASAEIQLFNPIERSFRPQAPRTVLASAVMQEPPVAEAADAANGAAAESVTEEAAEAVAPAVEEDTAPPADSATPDAEVDLGLDVAEDAPTRPNEDTSSSASDIDIPEPLDEPDLSSKPIDAGESCGECCGECCCGRRGRLHSLFSGSGKPWGLPQPRILKNHGIKVGGWIQGGITTNNTTPTDNYNSLLALNDRDGEFQFNQMWFYIAKPIKQEACRWQAGGHIDAMYGTDWRYGRFFGLEERINGDDQLYGLVLPQMYAEFGGYNLSVKIGHMAGPLGYEIVPSVANFFYSHSNHMNYFEPQLMTGVWADYKLNDNWTVQGGMHRGWFMWEDLDSNFDITGGIQWTSCDKRTSIRYAFTSGRNHGLWGDNWFGSSLVLKHKFNDKWEYVLQHNLGKINNINPAGMFGAGAVGDEEWYGVNQYLYYTINKKLKAGMRVEWIRDDDGGKLLGVGNIVDRGWPGGPGYAGNFWEVTAGLNWSPCPNVRLRPEIRWDWYDGPPNLLDGTLPFDDFAGKDQITAAFDVLITF